MTEGFVNLKLDKVMQAKTYTVFVLKSEDKRFAIYATPDVGHTMQNVIANQKTPRPSSHHLMSSLFKALDIKPIQVVIWDVEDTVYKARLFIEQKKGEHNQIIEIDARPSDCLSLALLHHVPILCRSEVLDKVVCVED
ncbi:MAG TPA: DUF151 domain-containing protein [Chlamydiales bacterium]|nr:bifunctional nuclease family protein [Chlamydiales bacterium]HPE85126.1 DUF151 domain-containing protein [Chlamydiales bacterium]